jgi:hypothetical protein
MVNFIITGINIQTKTIHLVWIIFRSQSYRQNTTGRPIRDSSESNAN